MNFTRSLCVLLGLSFTAVAGGGASGAAAGAPSRAGSGAPITAGVVKRTLPNGLRVLVLPRRTAPVVTTMMWYRVGSKDELPGATGLAHFLEHLMFKGTRKLKKGEVDRLTYQNGGSNNAFTFNDYTAYEFNLPRQSWKVALEIEADRMRNCSFDAKEFEAERQVVMEERRISEDEPAQQFAEQLNAITYVAHPYRNPVIGWMADLKRVTRDEVYAFYLKHYRPSNATLVITGDVSAAEALTAAEHAFRAVPALPPPAARSVVEPPPTPGTRRLVMSLPTQVARFAATFHAPTRKHADTYALQVLDYALTEGKLSRLHRRLVDGDQLAAEIDGSLGVYREAGEYSVWANAREGVALERVEAAVWDELRKVADSALTATELERAKNQFYSDWVTGLESTNELATVLGEADALGGHQYLDTLLAKVLEVTAADVQRVAKTYLRRDRAVVGHLLPEKAAAQSSGSPAPTLHSSARTADSSRAEHWAAPVLTANEQRGPGLPLSFRKGGRGDRSVDGEGPGASQQRGVLCSTSVPGSGGSSFGAGQQRAGRILGKGVWELGGSLPSPRNRAAAPAAVAPSFAALKPVEKVLPNGMRLILLEKHDLPSVTFSTRINAGAYQEPDAEAGVAGMVARMLEEGTKQRSHQEISEALEQVGAAFAASAGRETSAATLQTLSRYASDLLPLYAELITAPSFPANRLDQERSRALVELTEEDEDAATVARKRFNKLVYGAHPGARPASGTAATLGALRRGSLAAYHRRFYRPEAATLVAVGDFHTPDLLRQLTEAFGGWRAEGRAEPAPLPAVARQTDRREERLTMDKAQTQIVLGHLGVRRSDPNYLALKVLDTILGEGVGGGFTARIPYQLRDVQGLAYGVGSSVTRSAAKEPGVFVAALGTAPANEKKAIAALLAEIRKVRAQPVTETELREAASYLANSYVFDFETNAQLAAYLDAVQYHGLGYNYRREFVQRVKQVTRADVLRVAKQYLDPERYSLVVISPPAKK